MALHRQLEALNDDILIPQPPHTLLSALKLATPLSAPKAAWTNQPGGAQLACSLMIQEFTGAPSAQGAKGAEE